MLKLYAHPFSSYCQKVLIPLYENSTPFEMMLLGSDPAIDAEHEALWPLKKLPILVDDGRTIVETSIIVEHLHLHHPGPVPMLPDDPHDALEVRMMDRIFDNYVMTPMQRIVLSAMRAPDQRDPLGVADAHAVLDTTYRWLDSQLHSRQWAAGESFGLADCAAAPALFYTDWVREIPAACANLRAYRSRLLKRPSFARAVDEARPYRNLFPPGAPDRD